MITERPLLIRLARVLALYVLPLCVLLFLLFVLLLSSKALALENKRSVGSLALSRASSTHYHLQPATATDLKVTPLGFLTGTFDYLPGQTYVLSDRLPGSPDLTTALLDFNGAGLSYTLTQDWIYCGYNPTFTHVQWLESCPRAPSNTQGEGPSQYWLGDDGQPGSGPYYERDLLWGEGANGWWLRTSVGDTSCSFVRNFLDASTNNDFDIPILDARYSTNVNWVHLRALPRFRIQNSYVDCSALSWHIEGEAVASPPTETPTETSTPAPSNTPSPLPFPSTTATVTAATFTVTVTATATATATVTGIGTPTPTSVPTYTTYTPIPTWTPHPTRTGSPTATPPCVPEPAAQWSVLESPNPGYGRDLRGVTALAPDDIWMVGTYTQLLGPYYVVGYTLVLHWDGEYWDAIPSPNIGAAYNELIAVTALSPSDIWAVGVSSDGTQQPARTLVEHWDGASWSIVPSPNVGTQFNGLVSVAAIGPNDIWAVGYYGISGYTLTEHWDGTQWSIVPSPNLGVATYLFSVSGNATNDVWAVGYYHPGSNGPKTFAIHWNGSSWNVVATPNPNPDAGDTLSSVIAITQDDAWAVGDYQDPGTNQHKSMFQHWNGTAWAVVPSPNGSEENFLTAITAVSSNDVWAVGNQNNGFDPARTLVEHWDGAQWSVVPSPNGAQPQSDLAALAAISGEDVWGVGETGANPPAGSTDTLVLHYSRQCIPSTITPTMMPSATPSMTPYMTATFTPTTTNATNTATSTRTEVRTGTPALGTVTYTPVSSATPNLTCTSTASPNPTGTATSTATATVCAVAFVDVHPSDYFYEPVSYLACAGAISGYSDGTFRPYNNTTRGQLSKIVVLAKGWRLDITGGPHFSDVLADSPFYLYIETAYNHHVISGYDDGTFRWGNNVTRGQLSKIIVSAEEWTIDTTGGPHFSDVSLSNPFYDYIETAYNHTIISGYSDGSFRPGNNATRGQISKIIYRAVAGGLLQATIERSLLKDIVE